MPTQTVQAKQEIKRNLLLKRLKERNVMISQQGQPIEGLDYDELKYEWVLASFREIDTTSNENSWF